MFIKKDSFQIVLLLLKVIVKIDKIIHYRLGEFQPLMSNFYPSSAHRTNTSHQYLNKSMKKSHSKRHYHQQSMDDFIKNIKKHNLRSQRYISSKPLLYMYARNNTTNTIDKERSRSISNRKSRSKSKKLKKKIQKIFEDDLSPIKSKKPRSKFSKDKSSENPGAIIQKFSAKISKAEKSLQKKNQVATYLCHKFQEMLNEIVEQLVNQLDEQINQIQTRTVTKIKNMYEKKLDRANKYSTALENKLSKALQKLENNTNFIYQLRLLSQIDIENLYGRTILGTDQCGGLGYQNRNQDYEQSVQEQYAIKDNQTKMQQRFQVVIKKQFQQISESGENESGRIRQVSHWQKQVDYMGQMHRQKRNST